MSWFCCSSVSCLKNINELFLPTLSMSSALTALRRKTSSTGPSKRSRELLPKAKQVTVSIAFAPDTWCLVYMRPALPNNVPAFFTAWLPKRSTVSTVPSITMNIQSPTSPSRKICSLRPKTCTVHAAASKFKSSSFMLQKVGSFFKKPSARFKCLSLSLSIATRKPLLSIFHRMPSCEHVTVAVRLTLYNMASSPKVCFDLSCFT
mmetsp:Transcript_85877/g.247853  ORF Transcript_85877/g.247853 Transcript_85877/m.247853 type:complete len:205 (+) Transcript_85877:1827-2441(+)